jgi:CxxC motif-containing protein
LFHILNACLGFQLILLFLFVPETAYERRNEKAQHEIERDVPFGATGDIEEVKSVEKAVSNEVRIEDASIPTQSIGSRIPAKKSFWQELAIFTGTHSDENLFQLIVAPVLCGLNLAGLWMIAIAGAITSFYVAQSYTAAQIYFYPPYNLSSAGVGYLFAGPFIGGALGGIVFALISDPIIIWCTKRNGGIYEPEFRIIPAVLGLIAGAGLCGYAALVQQGDSIYAASTLWGIGLFGIFFVVTPASAYAIDAYKEMTSELFIAAMMFKK